MAATYSTANVAGDDGGGTTRASASTVVPSGNVCYVLVGNSDGSPADPSGVVWDAAGVNESLTQIGTTISYGTYYKVSLYRGIGLTAKTATFTASWGSSQGERIVSVWVGTGIDTGTPNGTVVQNSATGTGSVTTGAVTTTVGQMLLTMMGWGTAGATLTANSPSGTERAEGVITGTAYDGAATQDVVASGTSTTATWTMSSTPEGWGTFAIPLNDAGAGPTGNPWYYYAQC